MSNTLKQLVLHSLSNEDYILYVNTEKRLGYEIQFDNKRFNGVISYTVKLGEDDEDWNLINDDSLYQELKEKAIEDYNKLFYI